MQLYDAPSNTGTRRIRALANELDMRLEHVPVNIREGEGQRPEYLKINPNGKIPSLVDGDFKLFETNAILCYLAARSGKATTLLPTDPQARAHVDQWLHWQNAHLNQAVMKLAMERVYKKILNLGAPDPARIEEGLKELDRFCTILDGQLAARDYVCGTLTVADFALAGTFSNRATVEIDLSRYTNLSRWLERIESRPSWVHAG
jgi:glutathione S-transferase